MKKVRGNERREEGIVIHSSCLDVLKIKWRKGNIYLSSLFGCLKLNKERPWEENDHIIKLGKC